MIEELHDAFADVIDLERTSMAIKLDFAEAMKGVDCPPFDEFKRADLELLPQKLIATTKVAVLILAMEANASK